MGYYITLVESDWTLPKENYDAALGALQALNHKHQLKRGGRHPETDDPFESKWFSWMPPRYHEEVESPKEVFEMLGFDCHENDDGLHLDHYDNKTGQEELFLAVVAPWVTDGSSLTFRGEEGEHFRYEYRDSKMTEKNAELVWS